MESRTPVGWGGAYGGGGAPPGSPARVPPGAAGPRPGRPMPPFRQPGDGWPGPGREQRVLLLRRRVPRRRYPAHAGARGPGSGDRAARPQPGGGAMSGRHIPAVSLSTPPPPPTPPGNGGAAGNPGARCGRCGGCRGAWGGRGRRRGGRAGRSRARRAPG